MYIAQISTFYYYQYINLRLKYIYLQKNALQSSKTAEHRKFEFDISLLMTVATATAVIIGGARTRREEIIGRELDFSEHIAG